ncbi:ANL family adenylate-forming protein [Idiomarina abyssalis]|uniref:ANL family adenylate-forming protein n=1 Tax=Idiomarina abyssalis TaxID=86102 RepID=UPI0006C856DB|nr:class I adenylate-forming enzyme family protein [Idiomarina abyssalis]SFT69676.1 Acyl-CoA synthetase (AMP-forming)/AMP-acid ligase II [Idiomarina abyssalis]
MLQQQVNGSFPLVTDIKQPEIDNEAWTQAFKGKRLGLHCHPASLVRAAIQLDGIAESVLLVPFDACENFIKNAEKKLELDFILTDGLVDTSYWTTAVLHFEKVTSVAKNNSQLVEAKTNWLLATSGTTGTPKIVAHTIESLTRTTAKGRRYEDIYWGLLYDPARFAGLQVVLQAIFAKARLIIPSPELDFEKKIEYLAEHGTSALSATPSLWRKILMSSSSNRLDLKQITLGGEIADQRILNSLVQRFPGSSITHIFASTEAGVGFSVTDKKAGFPSSWLQSGIRNVEMRVSDDGTLCLKNTHLNQKYLGDGAPIVDDNGWIDTGDLVEIENDRVFFKGRLNGAINIGGNKVIPEDVEAVIQEVLGVSQVAVRAKFSSIAGSLVEALVVVEPDYSEPQSLKKKVKEHCSKVLPSFKVPAFVKLVDELPVGSTGKIRR